MQPSLHQTRFRSSPFIDLRQLAELTPEQREPLLELQDHPEFYGLLVPRPPLAMNLKSVTRGTAELFRSLATPSRLDAASLPRSESYDDVIDLVLDGILEIEHEDRFVSGADALPIVCSSAAAPPDVDNRVSQLSHEALLYAQDLEIRDAGTLTMALYLYNRIPISPFWKTRFAGPEAVLSHLGADRGLLQSLLDRHWISSRQGTHWLSWSPRIGTSRQDGDVTYKLYVSPRPECVRDAFEIMVRVLADYPETSFKIGDRASGLLRPDKIVAYFATRELLAEVSEALHRELAGCEAQGVPFTAGLDESGLLSWGIDPPDSDRALRWLGRDSWRLWVAKRLGAAMAVAKGARSANAVEPWHFAVERTRRHGVDVDTWTPSAALWSLP